MDFISKNFRGVLFCFALAVPATYLGKLFPVVGAPVFAILFGLLLAFWNRPAFFQPGIQFTAKKILQYSAGNHHRYHQHGFNCCLCVKQSYEH